MNTHADKIQENIVQSTYEAGSQVLNSRKATFQFVDNRPESIAQRKRQDMGNNSSQVKQATKFQAKADNYTTGQLQSIHNKIHNTVLSDNLISGIENLSGYSMDDVKVNYNSDNLSQLQARAYAQGCDSHLGTRREPQLPHEAWHVAQQKQGRVKLTTQMKGKVNVNDDSGLEKEADVMESKALQFVSQDTKPLINNYITDRNPVQRKVTNFTSTNKPVDSPIDAYLNKADKRVFLPHQTTNETFDVRLKKIMPKTGNSHCQITSVSAQVSPNGPSEWDRRGGPSQMVGHAGVQEALFTTGSEAFYQGGHLISHGLLGKGSDNGTAYSIDDYINLVPMEGALNNNTYKKLESELAKKGAGIVNIDVQTITPANVPNGIVSALTECPLALGMNPGDCLQIPSTIARNVGITHSGTLMGSASEIPRMAPVNDYLTTGLQLLKHLNDIGSAPFLDPALAAKLAAL